MKPLNLLSALIAAALLAWTQLASAVLGAEPPLVRSVDAVGMTVSDMERSVAFFSRVLSFETLSEVEVGGEGFERLSGVFGARARVVTMRLGDERLELTEYLAPRGRPLPPDSRSNDRWFQHVAIVVSDIGKAYAWLRQNRVTHASTGPQRLPAYIEAAAGIQAFYFKDPDGHALEILAFPPDKGDPKWHRKGDPGQDAGLFLGIDHTAIVVADTDASLAFYRDQLGFSVAGESENYGAEQEHLNNVFGARLRITGLRAASGPGVEFLEYLAPRDGRPAPTDLRSNDIAHWQTTLAVADAASAERRLFKVRAAFVSPGAVALQSPDVGFRRGMTVRDPDGHAVRLVER